MRRSQVIEVSVIFEVITRQIVGPTETSRLRIPKHAPRDIKPYLTVSPQITYRDAKLKKQVKEIVADTGNAWRQVEAISTWVRDNCQYEEVEQKDSLSVFRGKKGCAEGLTGLFVAMCRAHKVAARMVWVEGHQYAEFYLEDPDGIGHWFPAQIAGRYEFGGISDPRIILQKGDSIAVPEKEHRQKFVAEFVSGSGASDPEVRFIRELLPAN
jgi:transglutaminase-like putative cysteine protease